jgi:hypothetical protein
MSKASSILLLSSVILATGIIIFGTELIIAKKKKS